MKSHIFMAIDPNFATIDLYPLRIGSTAQTDFAFRNSGLASTALTRSLPKSKPLRPTNAAVFRWVYGFNRQRRSAASLSGSRFMV
jgi:hypothetical protein